MFFNSVSFVFTQISKNLDFFQIFTYLQGHSKFFYKIRVAIVHFKTSKDYHKTCSLKPFIESQI